MAPRALVLGSSFAVIFSMSAVVESWAGRFDGWCFMEDVCTGPSKIEDDAFVTCESNCRLTKPTRVNGMDALLYDVICQGDHGSSSERMLLLQYEDHRGDARALAVDKHGAQELARCSRR